MTSQQHLRTFLEPFLSTSTANALLTTAQAKQLHCQLLRRHGHLPVPAVLLSWKLLIRSYTSHDLFSVSLSCFVQMRRFVEHFNHFVFPSVVKSCAWWMDVGLGECVHGCVVKVGLEGDLYVGNALLSMYSKFGVLCGGGARQSNNASVGMDAELGLRRHVAHVVREKSGAISPSAEEGGRSDESNASLGLNSLSYEVGRSGKERKIVRSIGTSWFMKRERGNVVGNSVRKIFDAMPARDLVSWNTVIAGNVQSGMYDEALVMVRKMGLENIRPDAFTLSSMLPMCAEYADVVKAKEVHGYAVRHGIHDNVVIGSSLIDVYAKCTRIQDFFSVFNGLPRRDGITWNSMIAACVQNGLSNEGFEFFRCMVKDNLKPGPLSFSSIIPACSHLTSLIFGKQLHGYIVRTGLRDNVFIASSLVDMYAKCGKIEIAKSIFSNMKQHDLVSWTAIIMGCALHGQALDALKLFNEMEVSGVRPSYVSFIAILTACSHSGLVEEARKYYDRMIQEFGITPGVEHYAAMADLLGRAGRLEEAYDFICKMPAEPPGSLWCQGTMTGMCKLIYFIGKSWMRWIQVPSAEPCLVEQRTNNCAHVACRLCGQVFANSVALVNHIDMHVSRDMELARRAGNFGLFQFPCILPLNPAQPTNKLMLGGPPFAQGREHAAPPLNQTRAAIPPRNLSFGSPQLASPDYIFRSQPVAFSPIAVRQIYAEAAAGDQTKPFLCQLDLPIADSRKRGRTDDTGKSSTMVLDLTLKL
ncbi:hypothetical protein MLD38_018121 [Melastoma candidum]|uniref:Uncharacterized protein n=1 Tax=Melastoma candidum TaxID=119954 RepID=A0ACB9QU54_9MYRT|nr:hypothetical protein MLD38_018121 [Melastoma candidum]